MAAYDDDILAGFKTARQIADEHHVVPQTVYGRAKALGVKLPKAKARQVHHLGVRLDDEYLAKLEALLSTYESNTEIVKVAIDLLVEYERTKDG